MLILVFAFVIFFWLCVGALQFLFCVSIPRLRRYALSAALWWALWGPCSVALMMVAGLAVVAEGFARTDGDWSLLHARHLPEWLGWGYFVLGVLGTAAIATGGAWLHQAVVRRFPFALFRVYAVAVSAGIGSVFGWIFSFWMSSFYLSWGWVVDGVGMLALVAGFGVFAYRGARSLRGTAPEAFAWVSKEESEGV